jgi:uncharacterized protein (TIGR02118 family)
MNWALELRATGTDDLGAQADAWLDHEALRVLLSPPSVAYVDVYSPISGANDPFVAEELQPLLFVMAYFRDREALCAALCSDALDRALSSAPAGLAFTATPLRRKAFAVIEPTERPRAEPYKYVVRYHGPTEAAADFAAHYQRTHPPLLAKLPRIRSIDCYELAGAFRSGRIAPVDYLIGNEVGFDSADDFNAAMASPARAALRADFDSLPRIFHRNTHFAMQPTRHFARERERATYRAGAMNDGF